MNRVDSLAITIRPLTSQDAESYSALRRQIAAESCIGLGLTLDEELARPIQEFADQLASPLPNIMLGAFDGSTLIATAGIARASARQSGVHKAVLWGVLTSPAYRRRSLAHTLSTGVIEHACATGAERVCLYVYLPNEPAVRLYEALGFVTTSVEPEVVKIDGVYHDLQQMSRRYV